MCHKKSLFSPPELSAGGATRDTCLALPAISRLWPSDDDDDVYMYNDERLSVFVVVCFLDGFHSFS